MRRFDALEGLPDLGCRASYCTGVNLSARRRGAVNGEATVDLEGVRPAFPVAARRRWSG